MARHLRIEFAGAIYHVTCRMLGDAKSRLFRDDADRERFLEQLSERVEQYNIRLYMFVLMTNHFHLVLETPEGNCSKFMQSISTAYTVYYNLRHNRHGHLFDGRYKAKLVEKDDYLLALSRYVHLNPVKVPGMKDTRMKEKEHYLRQYPWSSYQSYINRRKNLVYVECEPILTTMSGRNEARSKQYRHFVESGLAEDDEGFKEALKESPRSIGSDSFRVWIDGVYRKLIDEHERPEDISFRRITEPLSPKSVLGILAEVFKVKVEEFCQRRRNSPLRAVAAKYLCRYAGQTQREVGELLQIGSGAAVSQHLSRCREMLLSDRKLVKLLQKAERRLNERKEAISKDCKLLN